MTGDDRIVELLTEIRDQQREQLELAREQAERSRASIDESIGLQRAAMDKYKAVTRFVFPLIVLCVLLIVYLIVRFL